MKDKRKMLIVGALLAIIVIIGGIVSYFWYENTYYVSTEDARASADLVNVSSQVMGKLLESNVNEGDAVIKNQILARQDISSVSDANIEQSLVRSPIDGIVVKKQGTVGEIWSPSQTMLTLIDSKKIYVSANIEETKISKIQVGQPVEITIDQFGSQKFNGKVSYVGDTSNSALSLISSSTSGTFTKVVQRIPIKIQLDDNNGKIRPGTNAVIKIHVK